MLDGKGMGADTRYNRCCMQAVWIGAATAAADPVVLTLVHGISYVLQHSQGQGDVYFKV